MENNNNFRRSALDYRVLHSDSMTKVIEDIQEKMASATDNMILQQLNEFISRGLIVVEVTQPVLVRSADAASVQLCQGIRLVLKDQEYIEQLERQNATLKEHLDNIKQSVSLTFQVKK